MHKSSNIGVWVLATIGWAQIDKYHTYEYIYADELSE